MFIIILINNIISSKTYDVNSSLSAWEKRKFASYLEVHYNQQVPFHDVIKSLM